MTAGAMVARPLRTPNLPISLKIEPSAACQLACKGCLQARPEFKEENRGHIMDPAVFSSVLDQCGDSVYRIQFYFNGEPFINTHLLEMISAASARNIGSQVSTNFSFSFKDDFYRNVVESGLEHLIISMDGTDAETYSQYRVNGRFDVVEHGMREVVRWKRALKRSNPVVEWQFIIFDHNRHQIPAAEKLAGEIGVDRLCLKYDGYSDPSTWAGVHRKADERIRRVRLNSCLWLWGAMVVDWNGVVHPCCYRYPVGDVTREPLREIWNGPRMRDLRAYVRMRSSRRENHAFASHLCHGCRFIM